MESWSNVVSYRGTYSSVINWMYVRSMLTLGITRELHTRSVNSVLAYTQADVKPDIFIEPPIIFGVEGAHPR